MLPSVALNAIPLQGKHYRLQVLLQVQWVERRASTTEGATLEQATKYGVVSGTVEGIIEMASGGVAGVGSGWLSKAFLRLLVK